MNLQDILNQHSKLTAIGEILLPLIGAAAIGWLAARLIMNGRIRSIKEIIEIKKIELADCRSIEPAYIMAPPVTGGGSKTVYPVAMQEIAPPDDLKIIEGIGPKIQEFLNKEGVYTFRQLSETSIIRISAILKRAGPRYQIHDPSSWPKQAALAKDGKWEELQVLKNQLISGKE